MMVFCIGSVHLYVKPVGPQDMSDKNLFSLTKNCKNFKYLVTLNHFPDWCHTDFDDSLHIS